MDVRVLFQTSGVSSLWARREGNTADMARKSWMGAEMSDVFHPQTQGLLGDRAV